MATLITHFRNEAKLLPFWLKHHTQMFEHGILIDHHSTDDSVEMCRKFAPHWRVVTTKLKNFSAIDTDFEVMLYERELSGWKMVLNVTEFLHFPDFAQRLLEAEASGVMTIRSCGIVMVDNKPDEDIDVKLPLIKQKHHGFIEKESQGHLFDTNYFAFQGGKISRFASRQRIIHRYPTGAYYPGRHKTFHEIDDKPKDVFTLWYAYSPWTDWNIERKLSISSRIPDVDKKQGRGWHHLLSLNELQKDYGLNRDLSYDILPILEGKEEPPSPLMQFLKMKKTLLKASYRF